MHPTLYWLPELTKGRLAIAARPRGGDWLSDDLKGLRAAGVDLLVSLLEPTEAQELELADEEDILEKLLTGGAPAYLLALAIQVAYFRRLELVRHRGYLLPGGLIALSFAIALPLTLAFWAIMPPALVEFFAPHQSLSADWLFLLLLPSTLAAAIGVMTTCWLARRARDAAAA